MLCQSTPTLTHKHAIKYDSVPPSLSLRGECSGPNWLAATFCCSVQIRPWLFLSHCFLGSAVNPRRFPGTVLSLANALKPLHFLKLKRNTVQKYTSQQPAHNTPTHGPASSNSWLHAYGAVDSSTVIVLSKKKIHIPPFTKKRGQRENEPLLYHLAWAAYTSKLRAKRTTRTKRHTSQT